jgi:Leucine-rich repeat (LRR) protein
MMSSGNIPETLGSLTNLQYLGLSENQLSGTYPAYVQTFVP